jgi:RND family efflux transporter MFP subunit
MGEQELSKGVSVIRVVLKIFLPLCLILGGGAGFKYFQSKEVKMKRTPPEKHAAVVETLAMAPGSHKTRIQAMGIVMPDKEVILKAQVSGEVVRVSPGFVQGGMVKKGEILIWLENSDYKLAVDKARSDLDKALADFEIEKGQQFIAREELRLITQVSPEGVEETALALRKPQLEQARAEVAGEKSDFEKAKLDLKRTQVRAPFHGLILEKNVDLGSMAASQGTLATLVDITQYQVETQVPLDRLRLLEIDEERGSPARIRSQYTDHEWQGKVVRTTGKITGQSRMAGVIIQVPDPLGLENNNSRHKLLLGDHVEALILGRSLDQVYALPRSLLRENNTLWIYKSGRLDIRQTQLVWKEKERFFIRSGINPGDKVIVSDIPVPVQGMALTLAPGEKS